MKLVLFSTLAILCGTWISSAFAADKWVKTVPADLLTGDVVAIVDQTSSTALPNSNGESAAPAATMVTLSDDQLAAMMKERGFPIARRTVAKYRELLGIPIARMRRGK